MGVMDKFISAMKLSEDEDEGYYDDDFYDEPEPIRKPVAAKDMDTQDEDKTRKLAPKVTPLRQAKKMGSGMEVCVIKPTSVLRDIRQFTEDISLYFHYHTGQRRYFR